MSETWGPWLEHDDSGMPPGVHKWTIVQADLSGDILSPMEAEVIDWHCPDDPVTRYRTYAPKGMKILKKILNSELVSP